MITTIAGYDVNQLTRTPTKASLYQRDPFFREAAYHFGAAVEDQIPSAIFKITLVVLRPDCLIMSKGLNLLQLIEDCGFSVLIYRVKSISRVMMRLMWLYPFSHASVDRLHVLDRLFDLAPSVILLVWNRCSGPDWPASVNLSLRKGPADPVNRPGHDLRTILESPNRILSLFHVSDEPADVLRELGILFNFYERAELFRCILSSVNDGYSVTGTLRKALIYLELNSRKANICERMHHKSIQSFSTMVAEQCPLDSCSSIWQGMQHASLSDIDRMMLESGCTCKASMWKSIQLASNFIMSSDPTAIGNILGRPIDRWVHP